MLVKPNKTVLRGRVRAIRPEPDGVGASVEIEVLSNDSPSEGMDFLRPSPGSMITLYAAEPEGLSVGGLVRAETRLLAGPGGGRAVLEAVKILQPGE